MPTYLEKQPGRDPQATLAVILIGDVAMMEVIPLAGTLWDRDGRTSMCFASPIGLFRLALPMPWPTGRGFALVIMAFAVLGLSKIPQLPTLTATSRRCSPLTVRFAGSSVTGNVAPANFGGTSAILNQAVIEKAGFLLFSRGLHAGRMRHLPHWHLVHARDHRCLTARYSNARCP